MFGLSLPTKRFLLLDVFEAQLQPVSLILYNKASKKTILVFDNQAIIRF